ncbi:MAG TPA: M20 family peptidase [Candidatus Bathyarchaeota archaeon]|nr:M20 family peptidase [Candidatus Bathyarchaeota archaeon]
MMRGGERLRKLVLEEVDRLLPRLIELSDWIGMHPELGSEEYEASKRLSEELERHGFKVERGILNMPTAFRASYSGVGPTPRIAFMAEYDALPEIGHGCGHNIIGAAAIGAGIALRRALDEVSGTIFVYGTPAEEGRGPSAGAKRRMAEAGLFDDLDVAMMIHPTSGITRVNERFLAVTGITVEFEGRAAHAAAFPHLGVNALNAAVLMYMAVHANRQQLRRDANAVIHGIIREGGAASNIIPDRAVLQFGVRSSDDSYIPELVGMVENCARGAAIATGCKVHIDVRPGLKSNVRNEPLERLLYRILSELGEEVEPPELTARRIPMASTDFSDVTHVVPAIHPMISIAPEGVALHTREFAEATMTERGHRAIGIGAKAMALAALELILDPRLLEEVKEAHRRAISESS